MLLAARICTALLAAVPAIVATTAVASEPAPTTAGCIAASESGQDLRHTGRLIDARTQFEVCVAESCPGPIREDCAQRLKEVAMAIPTIVFDVTDSVGNDVPNLVIRVNEQPIAGGSNAMGTAVELDPGAHTVTFRAAGMTTIQRRVVLVAGVKQQREVVIMDRAEGPEGASSTSPPVGEARTPWAAPPTLAWAAFGIGGAGMTLGVMAGLVAGAKHSTLESNCNNSAGTCTAAYADDLDSFHAWRTVSTVGYVIGALGVAGGAVLWFTTPKKRNAPIVGVSFGPASAAVSGAF